MTNLATHGLGAAAPSYLLQGFGIGAAIYVPTGLLLLAQNDLEAVFLDATAPALDLAGDLASLFFETDSAMGFAQTFTHSGTDYNCIYDSPSVDGDGKAHQLWVSDATAAQISTADAVTVETVVYVVAGKQPDGTGVTVITLYEHLS